MLKCFLCFVTNKILEKPDSDVFSNGDIDFDDIYSGLAPFFNDNFGLTAIDVNSINLDDENFDEDYLESIIHVIYMV